jgi:GxxExxY protein
MVVESEIIVELKAVDAAIAAAHLGQCLNYLRASGLKKGMVLNFGRSRVEYRRVVL